MKMQKVHHQSIEAVKEAIILQTARKGGSSVPTFFNDDYALSTRSQLTEER